MGFMYEYYYAIYYYHSVLLGAAYAFWVIKHNQVNIQKGCWYIKKGFWYLYYGIANMTFSVFDLICVLHFGSNMLFSPFLLSLVLLKTLIYFILNSFNIRRKYKRNLISSITMAMVHSFFTYGMLLISLNTSPQSSFLFYPKLHI